MTRASPRRRERTSETPYNLAIQLLRVHEIPTQREGDCNLSGSAVSFGEANDCLPRSEVQPHMLAHYEHVSAKAVGPLGVWYQLVERTLV